MDMRLMLVGFDANAIPSKQNHCDKMIVFFLLNNYVSINNVQLKYHVKSNLPTRKLLKIVLSSAYQNS